MSTTPSLNSDTAKALFTQLADYTDEVFQTVFEAYLQQKNGSTEVPELLLEAMQDATQLRRMMTMLLKSDGYKDVMLVLEEICEKHGLGDGKR